MFQDYLTTHDPIKVSFIHDKPIVPAAGSVSLLPSLGDETNYFLNSSLPANASDSTGWGVPIILAGNASSYTANVLVTGRFSFTVPLGDMYTPVLLVWAAPAGATSVDFIGANAYPVVSSSCDGCISGEFSATIDPHIHGINEFVHCAIVFLNTKAAGGAVLGGVSIRAHFVERAVYQPMK